MRESANSYTGAGRRQASGQVRGQEGGTRRQGDRGQQPPKRQVPVPVLVALAVVLVVVMVVFGRFCSSASTISITVNGSPVTLHGAKTMNSAIDESGLPINPGDLISLKGSVLKRSAGYPFYATVNGQETVDPDQVLHEGDTIEVTDGKDKVEDYDAVSEAYPHDVETFGMGSLCVITLGEDGVIEHRTGRISGQQADKVTVAPKDTRAVWQVPDVGDDKVIALTFDQGPSSEYTAKILDILQENDVRATFFCVGNRAESNPDLVRREWFAYNQVCTNTYDHNLTNKSSAEEIASQIEKGRQAIAGVVGTNEISRIVRLPDKLTVTGTVNSIDEVADVMVGWDVDITEWVDSDVDQIYEAFMSAKPGNIITLNDGGDDDLSNTVEALRKAVPELKKQGYSFVTISELLNYPAQ